MNGKSLLAVLLVAISVAGYAFYANGVKRDESLNVGMADGRVIEMDLINAPLDP